MARIFSTLLLLGLLVGLTSGFLQSQGGPPGQAQPEVTLETTFLEVAHAELKQLGVLMPRGSIFTYGTAAPPAVPAAAPASASRELRVTDLEKLTPSSALAIPEVLIGFLKNSRNTKLLQSEPVADGSHARIARLEFADGSLTLDHAAPLRVLPNGDVRLQVLILLSAHTGDRQISGVTQPIFSNQSVTHIVSLAEGESVLLAGIPIGQDQREVVVAITPHFVRPAPATTPTLIPKSPA